MTAPVEVSVYAPDATTLIATLTSSNAWRLGTQCQDEMNGLGAGSFLLHLDDAVLAAHPEMLDAFNVVKVRPVTEAEPVMGWLVETLMPAQVSEGENADRVVEVSGRHVKALLDSAVVTGPGDSRYFGFASPTGSWLVSGDWVATTGVAWEDDSTARAGNPVDWPDPLAQWVWSSNPEATAPAERNWFRGSFTLASDTDVTIWASCDNSMSLLLNGEPIITTDPTDLFAWRKTYVHRVTLPAGTHLLAAWVDNAASTALNPGGFICAVGTTDSQGEWASNILRTGNAAWKVHAASNPPGWHAAAILLELLEEAQADGYLPDVTWDFTDTLDSDGQPWTDRQDERLSVTADLLTVSNLWAGTVFDLDMTPDLVLRAFVRKGSDLSATVAYTAGVDVKALAPTVRYGQIRNVALTQHPGGWVAVPDNTSITAYGKRATGLSLGGAGTEAQAISTTSDALADLAWPQITLPLEATSVVGPQPFADFNTGDTISAPGWLTGQADARVIAWTLVEEDNHIRYSLDLYPEAESAPEDDGDGSVTDPFLVAAGGGTYSFVTTDRYITPGVPESTTAQWFRWTPSASGTATIRTTGTPDDQDSTLTLYTGSPGSLVQVAFDDDSGNDPEVGHPEYGTSIITYAVTSGVTYLIQVDAWDPIPNGVLTVEAP